MSSHSIENISAIESVQWLRRRVNKLIDDFKKNENFVKLQEINITGVQSRLYNVNLLMDGVIESIFTIMKQLESLHDNVLIELIGIDDNIKELADETEFKVNKLKLYYEILSKIEEHGRVLDVPEDLHLLTSETIST